MSNNRIGAPGAQLPILKESPRFDRNIVSGSTSTYVYEGSQAECQRQCAIDIGRGATESHSRPLGNGNWELQSVFPWGLAGWAGSGPTDPPTNTHELDLDSLQPSVWGNPLLIATLSNATLAAVCDCTQRWERGDYAASGSSTAQSQAETDLSAQLIIAGTSSENTQAIALFRQVAIAKESGYSEEHYVYKRTITVGSPLQVKASFYGCGVIWTTSEILSWEKPPAGFYFALPTAVWLKSKPRVSAVAGQKVQITYQYKEAIGASGFLYNKLGAANLTNYIWTT